LTSGVIYDTIILPCIKYTKREKPEKGGGICSGGLCSMARDKKSLEAIRRNPRNVALRDFEALIKQYGYIEEGAKHPKAIIGTCTMPYKRESPVKSCYVKELLEIIEEREA